MAILLLSLSVISFLMSLVILSGAQSAIHEGVAAMLFVASACWACTAAVCSAYTHISSQLDGLTNQIEGQNRESVELLKAIEKHGRWQKLVKTKELKEQADSSSGKSQ